MLSTPSIDVSFGAAYVHDSAPTHLIGWLASASRAIGPSTSLVAEVGRHAGDNQVTLLSFPPINATTNYTETSASGGLRFAIKPGARTMPFGQLLVGINSRRTERSSFSGTTTTWQVQPDLGMDVLLSGRFCARAQIGFRYLMNDAIYRNEFRASVGLVVRFGQ